MGRAVVGVVVLGGLYLAFALVTSAGGSWQPSGYKPVDSQVASRWVSGTCATSSAGPCWHALLVARYGCSGGLSATLGETRGRLLVGAVSANAPPVAPLSPVELEFDASTTGPLSGAITAATCTQTAP
jgi:hypothetical protein